MDDTNSYFFCGIGGSGMLPLACILHGRGARVAGSDRSLDQGRVPEKFDFLSRMGIELFPQDGSGVTHPDQILITSAAVETTIPDVVAARRVGARHITRPQLLARLFNAAPIGIAVAGTSGKSTVTGMIAWILHFGGAAPTVMNGAVMKNFVTPDIPIASALIGEREIFVSEVDESDGSIALYDPEIAVLNNISLDHKSIDELRALFLGFVARTKIAILNLDDPETRLISDTLDASERITFSFVDETADFLGSEVTERAASISFRVTRLGDKQSVSVRLQVPGRHNAYNALAALAAVVVSGADFPSAAAALGSFEGLRRRFEIVGSRSGITVIDDFGHNPDKISATLATLHAFPGRLLILFQPHGYGPLRAMRQELIDCFAENLKKEDVLILPDPAFFGGTVDRTITSRDIVDGVLAGGRLAEYVPDRDDCAARLRLLARSGDRIIVMGARDDTLSHFAADLLESLA